MSSTTPILVVTRGDDPNRFAGHLAEQLRMEGLNWLTVHDLDGGPLADGEALPELVIACAVDVDEGTAAALAAHVRRGGALLAARPGAELATALGFVPPEHLWASRYVVLDGEAAMVAGLPWAEGGVQYVGKARAYLPAEGALSEATTAAWLAPFPGQRTRYPAVSGGRLGRGRVVVFAYDPAESGVRQQQGVPEHASTGAAADFDGDGCYKPNDLFLGQLDPARRDVPQADLQRTLLLRTLEWLTADRPLPRLWRFPDNAAAAALVDGDSDSMSLDDLRLALRTCDRYAAPFATYLKPEHIELLDPHEERACRARGHRFGVHPWAGPRPEPGESRAALAADCAAFVSRYGYRPRIHRGHWLVWTGWVDHAVSLRSAGIRLDGSFSAGRNFQGGYVNGTGLPSWFVDGDGALLDVAEQSTISTDDGWLLDKTGLPAMTLPGAIARSCAQIDAAADRYHTVYHPYFHPVLLAGGRALPVPTLPWLEAVLAHCRYRGLPFLDAEQWIDWNDARRSAALADLAHLPEGAGVRFSLVAPADLHGATVLVPWPEGVRGASVQVEGVPVHEGDEARTLRHGRPYACVVLSLRARETRTVEVRWRSVDKG